MTSLSFLDLSHQFIDLIISKNQVWGISSLSVLCFNSIVFLFFIALIFILVMFFSVSSIFCCSFSASQEYRVCKHQAFFVFLIQV